MGREKGRGQVEGRNEKWGGMGTLIIGDGGMVGDIGYVIE